MIYLSFLFPRICTILITDTRALYPLALFLSLPPPPSISLFFSLIRYDTVPLAKLLSDHNARPTSCFFFIHQTSLPTHVTAAINRPLRSGNR